jgi:O-antigen/teichoic acid export membrane protein
MKIIEQAKSEKALIFYDQIIVSGCSFLTNVFLARTLGAFSYGKFASLGLIQLFFLSISMSFFSQIFQVVYPNLTANRKKNYTASIIVLQGFIMLAILLIGLTIYGISQLYFTDYSFMILAVSITTPLLLIQDFLRRILITSNLIKKALIADVITNVLQISLIYLAYLCNQLSIVNCLYIIGLTFIPSILFSLKGLSINQTSNFGLHFSWQTHKQKSVWLTLSAFLQWSSGYFFIVVAGWWIGASAMGALRLAQYIFGLLNILLQAIESYALPKAVLVNNKITYCKMLLKKMLLVIVPILLVMSFAASQVFEYVGGETYKGYEFVIYGLCIIYFITTISYPIRIMIRSLHLNKEYFLGYLFSTIFSICTAFVLLKNFGLYGVLIGLAITQLITNGFWVISLKKMLLKK